MAFVHPSRRALVPQATPDGHHRGRDRSRDDERRRGSDRDRRRGNGDSAEVALTHRDRRSPVRSPVPRPTSGRESPKYDDYVRRHSSPPSDDARPRSILPPSGGESKRPETTPENDRPWRQQENMYKRDGGFDGGGDYFERYVASFVLARSSHLFFSKRRRQQRLNSNFSIWPQSPHAPTRELYVSHAVSRAFSLN